MTISDGWARIARAVSRPQIEVAELIEALRELVAAQREEINGLRRMLLDEKRVSRDVARLAMALLEDCDDGSAFVMREVHTQLADRVARIEEHRE